MPAARCAASRCAPSCAAAPSSRTARSPARRDGASRPRPSIAARRRTTLRTILDFLEQDSRTAAIARVSLSAGCVIALWQLLSLFVTNRLLLVPPADVVAALVKEAQTGAMWDNAV